jgi:pimeloyl-ACP methyl ester carboxylesterase
MKTHQLNLLDGQILEVVTEGDPHRRALVLHHGAFGSCENMAPIFKAAQSRGYFAIGITRPGYAASTRRAGRRARDYVRETQLVMDHFGVEEFVSLGWSSGSPAAISDLQDPRCKGAVTISGDAPRVSDDWEAYVSKYPPVNPDPNPPQESDDFAGFDAFRRCKAEEFVALFGSSLSQKDVEICGTSASEELASAMRHGMAPGDFGVLDDLESDAAPWNIELERIAKPVAVFQGDEDRMCTPAHGHFLSEKIPTAKLFLEVGEGHISLLYNRASEMVDQAIRLLN